MTETARCARSGCRNQVARPVTGRPRKFCSDACRQAAWRKRRARRTIFSSRSDDWPTDPGTFAQLDGRYGRFTLDVCANAENAKCARFYTREQNGLVQPWAGRVWMNPPYGRALPAWIAKAHEAADTTADIVCCLVPARTDTRWWHEHAIHGEIEFLRGRLRFGEAANAAPFPSAVIVFRKSTAVTKPDLGGRVQVSR